MLREIIKENINENYEVASAETGISKIILIEYINGNAKLNIDDTEKILTILNIKVDNKSANKIETFLKVREEEKKDRFKYYALYWLKKKRFEVKESTYCNYVNLLKNQIGPILGEIKFNELNGEILQYFIYKAQLENGLGEKTTKDCLGIIKQIIMEGQEDGVIPNFIFSKRKLKYKKQELIGEVKKVYTQNEYKKIIDEILKKIDNKKLGILLGIYTGMRIGELCALQFKDINFENNTISVTKTLQRIYNPENDIEPSKIVISAPKTQSSIRKIPITKEMSKILKKLMEDKENYVLTGNDKYTEPRTFRRYYENFLKKIDIEPIKFHSLRHTFASINIENGADIKTISEILGHSDIDTTLKIYTHTSEKQKEKAIEKFDRMFTKEEKISTFTCEYKGTICCISKKNCKLEFMGTIKEVAEYLDTNKKYICACINGTKNDDTFNIIPKIEGVTHKNGKYMGG